ncbi:MAG: hypothetical protein HON27_06530 [Candidatus Marinimicrobia bacterium]|jgi:hypothetical protein|nr:hypothetical protein [Candidatus Neomarinimicrobiota bacterium]MBT4945808.1 hypothetical protein [Candidatus Neomarinimicrobiota bacterium]MBT6011303.1 hypothetical protein [Candidatus Neomarinimicrobiota bacterium]
MIKVAKAALDTALEHLAETGWDIDNELQRLELHRLEYDFPRLRIDHNEEGKHQFFIDKGESYLSEDKQNVLLKHQTLPVIVLEEQNVRALWLEGHEQSRCAAVDGIIYSKEPMATACDHCPESIRGVGMCKPGVRLYVLPLIKRRSRPMVFNISPSSIRLWRDHQLRLARSGIPQIAVITTFELMDTLTEDYRWARVEVGIREIVSKPQLKKALAARNQISSLIPRLRLKSQIISN